MGLGEFSFRTRAASLRRLQKEVFDVLVVGGGITGAAVARDAATRGLSVALVERGDFSCGTSSRSSKLIHGGFRYLENFEFSLVFEALAERALLLKTMPHLVRPLPFYFPVYQGDRHGKTILGLGMWLYDLLALFRTPGFHRRFSKRKLLAEIPSLRADGLVGGYRYFDASMWDDVMGVEILRSSQNLGAAVCNYVEALSPLWRNERVSGFRVRDRETLQEIEVRARRTVICAGPWTDELGRRLSADWKPWLKPSKGVHLVFDAKRLPVPGAVVMSHPEDGRISFVIPRPDYGAGVVIVGTTDSPVQGAPERVIVETADEDYLLGLLNRYFPELKLSREDIVSSYVGVRPLVELDGSSATLQKVSREHHIDRGPGGVTLVAGGKYTTHRSMAEEIVDFTLARWREDARDGYCDPAPTELRAPSTRDAVNPHATRPAMKLARERARELLPRNLSRGATDEQQKRLDLLLGRYGEEALDVLGLAEEHAAGLLPDALPDPEGFPCLEAQLRHEIRTGMVMRLEDFYFRRAPLYLARADHGLPWAKRLAQIWAEERELSPVEAEAEFKRLTEVLVRGSY